MLYATTLCTTDSKDLLETALNAFLTTHGEDTKLLYSVYYEQQECGRQTKDLSDRLNPSFDLAFNDLLTYYSEYRHTGSSGGRGGKRFGVTHPGVIHEPMLHPFQCIPGRSRDKDEAKG